MAVMHREVSLKGMTKTVQELEKLVKSLVSEKLFLLQTDEVVAAIMVEEESSKWREENVETQSAQIFHWQSCQ